MQLTIAPSVEPDNLTLKQKAHIFDRIVYCNANPCCRSLDISSGSDYGKIPYVEIITVLDGERRIVGWKVTRAGTRVHVKSTRDTVPS